MTAGAGQSSRPVGCFNDLLSRKNAYLTKETRKALKLQGSDGKQLPRLQVADKTEKLPHIREILQDVFVKTYVPPYCNCELCHNFFLLFHM